MSDASSPITRVQYQNDENKILVQLDKEDFDTEQQYHIRMRCELNKALYKPGVLGNGLSVKNKVKDGATLWNILEIGIGIAIDNTGREIIVTSPIEHEIRGFGVVYFVRIKYGEITPKTADGADQKDRWEERPEVFLDPEPLDDKDDAIVLAKITLTLKNGSIIGVDIDESVRQQATLYPLTSLTSLTVTAGVGKATNLATSTPSEDNPNRKHALISRYADVDEPFTIGVGILGESKTGDGVDVKTCVIIDSTIMLNYSRHGRCYAV